jgi:hypothetical protein
MKKQRVNQRFVICVHINLITHYLINLPFMQPFQPLNNESLRRVGIQLNSSEP